MKDKNITFKICLVALAAVINVIGNEIVIFTRIPIYLDAIGSILVGAVLGPAYGALPSLISGCILGMTTDIYSFYFCPDGITTGIMAGLIFKKFMDGKVKRKWTVPRVMIATFFVTIIGTVYSAFICAYAFGGVTSSGSMYLVQILGRTPLGLFASAFIVQIVTNYADRLISMFIVIYLLKRIPLKYLGQSL